MPQVFSSREVRSSQTLSERLQAARRLRGVSLEDVARETGVQARYLEWIEEARFDLLPAGVYTKGFLSRYARAMNLPEDEILALYDHERGVDTNIRKARGEEFPEVKPISAQRTRFLLSPRTLRLSIALLLVVALAGYLVFQFRALSTPPILRVDSPASDMTIEATTFEVQGVVEEGSRLLLNGSDVRVGADGAFVVEVPLEPGENHLRFVATSPVGKETVLERTVVVPASQEPVVTDDSDQGISFDQGGVLPESVETDGASLLEDSSTSGSTEVIESSPEPSVTTP
ncbi:MAG: helix-turn-helix domain-containing protein [Candidatus Doudnabacteria bacterium]|nr:helix-turn-helix domain-containing protein [Candidatus Doudnabacteria bacterium]